MELDYRIPRMALVPPLMMDEPGGQKPSSWEVDYHILGMPLAPTLKMELGEELLFLEADCHTRDIVPALPLMMKLGEETKSFWQMDCHTRDTPP